ncbi:MAG TPA: hydroxymethylglutaryl-CoA lyase [Thermaerobacter sp.]
MEWPAEVTVREVGPRDGLQAEDRILSTEQKVELIDALTEAGFRRLEVTSFVHPGAIPQLADAEAVMARIRRRPGVIYSALVPNLRGAERALACGVDEISLFVSASETHNRHNVRRSIAESLAGFVPVAERAAAAGVRLSGYVVTAFGCPYEGDVPEEQVERIVAAYRDLGAVAVYLGDTTGMANPAQVDRLVRRLKARFPDLELGLHFHNTRGAALANVVAGLLAGVTVYDGAVGGLGGCPYAPGATGNVASEDLVHMLEEMGIVTGVDLDRLLAAARLAQRLIGRELPGFVLKAGKRSDLVRAVRAREAGEGQASGGR